MLHKYYEMLLQIREDFAIAAFRLRLPPGSSRQPSPASEDLQGKLE
jgi:hypothetical protein